MKIGDRVVLEKVPTAGVFQTGDVRIRPGDVFTLVEVDGDDATLAYFTNYRVFASVGDLKPFPCVRGEAYWLVCRNLDLGVFDGQDGFIGIREKFKSRFLDTEYLGPGRCGTVSQVGERVGVLPTDIPIEAVGPLVCQACEGAVEQVAGLPNATLSVVYRHVMVPAVRHEPKPVIRGTNAALLSWLAGRESYARILRHMDYVERVVGNQPETVQAQLLVGECGSLSIALAEGGVAVSAVDFHDQLRMGRELAASVRAEIVHEA